MSTGMEESGEQFTVVFALIVTEPASECVRRGWGAAISPLPLAGSVTIHAKTTVHCSPDSSMATAHRPPLARCYQLTHTEPVHDNSWFFLLTTACLCLGFSLLKVDALRFHRLV